MSDSANPWTSASQASLSFTISQCLLKVISIESVKTWNHLILYPAPPAFNLSQHQGLLPMNQLFSSGGQIIRASTSASVLPMNIQGCFLLGLIGLITLLSKGLSRVLSRSTVWKHHSSVLSLLHGPTLKAIHDYWKNHSFDYMAFVSKVMSLLFNTLSKFVIVFLPRGKCLLISWLQSCLKWFWSTRKQSLSLFPFFSPHVFAMIWWDQMSWSSFFWNAGF